MELFLKSFSPYLVKGEKEADPTTPQKLKTQFLSISEIPAPKKLRRVSFPQAPPISSITSSSRLGAMVETTSPTPKEGALEKNPLPQPWNASVEDSENDFNIPDVSEEEISNYRRPRGPLKHPSDSSKSDKNGGNNEPPKIPLQSSKRPSNPIKSREEATTKAYHFDMKLKLETAPTWDRNENTLARWIEKVGQLANTSPDI